jgi:beta-lactamase superfamily II metal-dependent hydrolase
VRYVFAILALLPSALPAQQLELRFLDVGQADAILVRESGKSALIDAGGGAGVLAQLRRLGVDTIDLLVASHNHADHIGGMTAVLGGAVVRFYLDNGVPHTTATYQRTIQAVSTSGAQYLRPTARTITLGTLGNARLRVLPPPPNVGDQNNSSVGILVQYGAFRALLTGDSEQFELQYWLQHDSIPQVTVVKVGHHGSWNGTTAEWAQATRPEVAVISVGRGNTYGHPSAQVIEQWRSVGATVYRTDQDGTVIVHAKLDGSYIVLNERTEAVAAPGITDPGRKPGVDQAPPSPANPGVSQACCRICTTGKACGNSCISRRYQCRQPPGCACDAKP